jgi:hypothetical protein
MFCHNGDLNILVAATDVLVCHHDGPIVCSAALSLTAPAAIYKLAHQSQHFPQPGQLLFLPLVLDTLCSSVFIIFRFFTTL